METRTDTLRIGAFKVGSWGDMVDYVVLLNSVKEKHPNSELIAYVNYPKKEKNDSYKILEYFDFIDEVIVLDFEKHEKSFFDETFLKNFTKNFDFFYDFKGYVAKEFDGSRHIMNVNRDYEYDMMWKEHYDYPLSQHTTLLPVDFPKRTHLELACESCNLPSPKWDFFRKEINPPSRFSNLKLLEGQKWATISMGLGELTKHWGYENWKTLCDMLIAEGIYLIQVAKTGESILNEIDHLMDLSVREMFYIFSQSPINISVENGSCRIRSLVTDKPSITLFGPTDSDLYSLPNQIPIQTGRCTPCFFSNFQWFTECHREEDKEHATILGSTDSFNRICMTTITPTMVFDKVREYFDQTELYNSIHKTGVLKSVTPKIVNKKPEYVSMSEFNEKVTCVFIGDVKQKEVEGIVDIYKSYGIEKIIIINSKTYPEINKIDSLEKYSKFCLTELYKYIETEFVLVNQWDGFILNPSKFRKDFFDYDFIGAPWWFKPNSVSGNGGFSLRSRNFLIACEQVFGSFEVFDPEDTKIDENSRELKNLGMKFAPKEISKHFSVENTQYDGQFGFHDYGTQNLPKYLTKQIYKSKFHHSGDLGDVIYSLPTIKELGGGVLILSSDYDEMDIRDSMTLQKQEDLKKVLMLNDYIVQVRFSEGKPIDIDYDLNDHRMYHIQWGNGFLTPEEAEKMRKTNLTELYRRYFNIPTDSSNSSWLSVGNKISFSGKPIIINRTARYHNKYFPWKTLITEYGENMMFVGTEKEHEDFCGEFGYVDYKLTESILDLFELISGCELFIGNQSFPYSLAEGIKKPVIQETDFEGVPNCIFKRDNSYFTTSKESSSIMKIRPIIEEIV